MLYINLLFTTADFQLASNAATLSEFMIPRLELKSAVFMKNCHCVRESEMLYRIIMNNSLLQFKICESDFKSQTHSKPSKYAVLNILILDFNTFIVRNTA